MFVGRKNELSKLDSLYSKNTFQMVVVYGRRRVGKTALVNKFGKNKRTLYFTALDQTDKDNLRDFSKTIYSFFGIPDSTGAFSSWTDALDFIADKAMRERFVFIFDEFPYAAERNHALPSAFQIAIDRKLKKTDMFLILCGSNQGFMENEVLGRKSPLYGRRTAQMKIAPLGYLESAMMLPGLTPQEEFIYYGCFGGVPYYLEQLDTRASLEDNLTQLYFDPTGFLFDEPYGLLRQEFREPALYGSILRAIANGANRSSLISNETGISQTTLPKYLDALVNIGIIEKLVPFGANPERSKKAIYRILDACYDFWFRFVMPRKADIEQGFGANIVAKMNGELLDSYLGFRFESLCAEWLLDKAKSDALPISATRIATWWGTDPREKVQTDIDVIAADLDTKKLLIAECKYRNSFNETKALESLLEKKELIAGYDTEWLALFTKFPCAKATIEKVGKGDFGDAMLITLDEMYA